VCNTDCDDTNRNIFPGNPNDIVCDGINSNCSPDGDLASQVLEDADHDGHDAFVNGTSPEDEAICLQNFKLFPIDDCNDHDNRTHPGLSETDPRFQGTGANGLYGDGIDNDCNSLIDDIIDTFVQYSLQVQLVALDELRHEHSRTRDEKKHSCEPNFALAFTLTNLAAVESDTNVIVKGRIFLPHDARLPTTVIGDLSSYGVKIDPKTGVVTWVQFFIAPKGAQLVAVPLCLAGSRDVRVYLNVTASDHTNYDLFFHRKFDDVTFP
jgi:hypothetical protein